jgi:hypothetical protein
MWKEVEQTVTFLSSWFAKFRHRLIAPGYSNSLFLLIPSATTTISSHEKNH